MVRRGASVTARSLRCTHEGCEVRWEARGDRYVCPCHGGIYDASGRPTAGPPKLPLPPVAARVEGNEVVIGG
jgi:menaquinol-cytochrome c reductase iron-sulfur subunit